MTPEEKLLALIQQDKRQAEPAASKPAAAAAPGDPGVTPAPAVAAPPATSPVTAAQAPAQEALPINEKAPKAAVAAPPEEPPPAARKLTLAEPVKPVAVPATRGETAPAGKAAAVAAAPAAAPAPTGPLAPVSAAAAGSVQTPVVTKVNAAAPRGRKASIPLLVMVNRALAVVVLVLVVFVFYSVASIRPGIAEDLRRQVEGAGSVSVSVATLVSEAVPEVGTYLGRLGSRNLFVPRSAAGGATNVVTEAAVPGKDLMLLGVSVEPSAEAESMAIIKNKADQKTFFVKPGEPVGDTGLTLEKVLADRVILKRQKQAFELK